MNLHKKVLSMILQPENETLEYKAVLPPSKSIAQIISSFANTNGGLLILGVNEIGGLKVSGLSEDFRANSMTHKAIDLLQPKPVIDYGYIEYNGKNLFAIEVQKSSQTISLEGKVFVRKGSKIINTMSDVQSFSPSGYVKIVSFNSSFENLKNGATDSKTKLIEHYQSILNMIDSLSHLLYPVSPTELTGVKEGKVLSRILFSSAVDNFETYLSDILFEIYLAKPQTLKSKQTVTIEEVLKCSDIQDFIIFWAKEKIGKLQKGSVKGFISENDQIRNLNVLEEITQHEIEKILQIRHLYAHRNGIVDDKFLRFFPTGNANGSEYQLSIDEILDKLSYIAEVVDRIDKAAIAKYNLSTI
ncbi:ATP-binding protein [Pedobacter aquatilis]|uniref:AlbA family DNA-binding domain-containing protein n=1 Tax=Pedobacter aquatilis TaxID=351343 RepID=UPI0025B578C7|nr:ATP-binding protein [Pedobacter aquatilis]MDN3587168.1 ATP-binding protein [Pedobacter aquatilis]